MPPKKKESDGKKPKGKSKKQKLLEEKQRQEEELQAQRDRLFKEESQYRGNLSLVERVERTEVRLLKNDEYTMTMVSKKKHQQLQLEYSSLSKQSTTDKTQLEKQLGQLTKAKDTLEKELNELKAAYKLDAGDLALIKKKLEGEMSSQGKCFVCVECARTIYKDRQRHTSVLID